MGNGIAIASCADCDPTASTHLAKILHPHAIFILLQHIAIKYGGFSFRDIATPCNILLQHIAIVLIRGAFLIKDARYGAWHIIVLVHACRNTILEYYFQHKHH